MITQIYGIKNLDDALMCAELGADHIGVAFGQVKHLGPQQKDCAQAKYIFDRLPSNVVKVGLTIASDVDEIIHDLSLCLPDVTIFPEISGTFLRRASRESGTLTQD